MALPGDLATCTVTGTFIAPDGSPLRGTVSFVPNVTLADPGDSVVIASVTRIYELSGGSFTATLLGTDASQIVPQGWAYAILICLDNSPPYGFTAYLPSADSPLDISELTPLEPVTQMGAYLLTTGGTMTGPLYAAEAPVASLEVATKGYVDSLTSGLSAKDACRVATAAPLIYGPATYSDGVLSPLTVGALVVDGVSVALDDRVLVKSESNSANNGIYLCTETGSVSAPWQLTRSPDMDTAVQVPGAYTFVQQGSDNAEFGFIVTGTGPFTLGTTAINWAQFTSTSDITAGTGLTLSGDAMSLADPVPAGYLPAATTSTQGAIGPFPNNTTDFLRADGSWDVPPGGAGTGTVNTWADDQRFASGRPWFDVDAFGADPTSTYDSTTAFSQAIAASLGGRYSTTLVMTASNATVYDVTAASTDSGRYINSAAFAAGYGHITGVTPGVSYTVAVAPTSGGTVSAFIGYAQALASVTPDGPVHMSAGTYKISSDLLIRSVVGFHLMGAGMEQTKLQATGTAFTTALLHVDGSLWSTFEHFSITGDGTEDLPNAICQEWTTASYESTSGNTYNRVHLVDSQWVNGWNIAGGTPQNDTTEWHSCLISGGQPVNGAWTSSGYWQAGITLGNGVYGNNYQHYAYNTAIVRCYRGWQIQASSVWIFGGAGAFNGTEFWFDGIANGMFTVQGYRCENAGLFVGGTATGLVECSMRDITTAGSFLTNSYWFHLSGGCSTWLLENVSVYDVGQSGQVPVLAFNDSGSGIGPRVTLINVNVRGSLASMVTLASGGGAAVPTGVAINYVDNSTSPATTYPFWYYGGTSWANGFIQPGTISTAGEIAITGTTAMTSADLGLMHKCTVSAAYTVTLPTPVGHAGSQVGVRVADSSTQLLTLATAAGAIDGASTRIMWAGESAMLESDGTNWVKISGKTIPMQGVMALASAQSIPANAVTNVPLTETYKDSTGLMCDPVTNQYITVQRPADYNVTARVAWAQLTAISNRTITVAYRNGSSSYPAAQDERYASTGGYPCIGATGTLAFAAGDYCTLSAFQSQAGGAALNASTGTPLYYGDGTLLSLIEIPAW